MSWKTQHWFSLIMFSTVLGVGPGVFAEMLPLRVTFENLTSGNSLALAPLRFGFGNGTFDSFNEGEAAFFSEFDFQSVADAPIVTVAEGGAGTNWLPAFAETEPSANIDSVLGPTITPFLPGESNSTTLIVDTANRYFTFGAMVVPSNDHFVGNDNPREYEVFDLNGNLVLDTIITQTVGEVWDAGSEAEIPANGAFLVGGVNAQRENENGVVGFNFSDFDTFNGLATPAGYNFDSSLLNADTELLRISFAVVPEPATAGLLGVGGVIFLLSRRRRK